MVAFIREKISADSFHLGQTMLKWCLEKPCAVKMVLSADWPLQQIRDSWEVPNLGTQPVKKNWRDPRTQPSRTKTNWRVKSGVKKLGRKVALILSLPYDMDKCSAAKSRWRKLTQCGFWKWSLLNFTKVLNLPQAWIQNFDRELLNL